MKLYRFSPIQNEDELFESIKHIHLECHRLCKQSFGVYLPTIGNVGVFCHYDDEYDVLVKMRKGLTEPSDNPNQKYFPLVKPIVILASGGVPETTYTHLYIRKPDPYRAHVGDIDFYVDSKKYAELKQLIKEGKKIKGARIFERPDLDMIELYDPDSDALGYISTRTMAETVRIKLSDATKL
jgi:hypothetical protein